MTKNKHIYILLDKDTINLFGIYSSSENMIYAYNNLSQKEKNKLIEYRVLSLNINKNEKNLKGIKTTNNYLVEAGVLNGEKEFPYII